MGRLGVKRGQMLKYEKVAVDHDRCEKIQELSENVDKLKSLMKKNLGKFHYGIMVGFGPEWVDLGRS